MRSLFLAVVLFAVPAHAATPVTGKWLNRDKDSIIEIAQCGATVCGRVHQILRPTDDGKPAVDRYNPNASLRGRPILGLTILSGFRPDGGKWQGSIYDPRNGKTYKSYLTRNADGTLKVQGCIAFLCQSQIWTAAR